MHLTYCEYYKALPTEDFPSLVDHRAAERIVFGAALFSPRPRIDFLFVGGIVAVTF